MKNQRLTLRMPAADTVQPGEQSTFRLPIGKRYHELRLGLTNLAVADIEEIRVIANTETIHRYSGTQRNRMNMFDGYADAATSGFLVIPFDRRSLKTRALEEDTSLQTGSRDENGLAIETLTVEVDIASGASNPGLKMWAVQSSNVGDGPGTILRAIPTTLVITDAGEKEFPVTGLGGAKRRLINRALFFTGDFSRLQVQRNNVDVFDRTTALNEAMQKDGVRVPQTGLWAYDPSEDGYGLEALDVTGLDDFRYIAQVGAAGSITYFAEYLGSLE